MAVYKGFSSYQFQENKQFRQTDIEIVKTNLIAHMFTRRGSRVMMPEFGTLIPDLLFEPLDDITLDIVESELRNVFNFDPRVEIVDFNMQTDADRNLVQASVRLFYIELNRDDIIELNLQFRDQ